MLIDFFTHLKESGLPVSATELFALLECLDENIVFGDVEDFYHLARLCMVKDEKHFDRFDRAFGRYFKDIEAAGDILLRKLPEDWLRKRFEASLSEAEKARLESLGGLEKLLEEFRKRLEEQGKRHEGGNKWIGTGGTSPFGGHGFHPEGIRIGQREGRNGKAVKVWERREYRDLDDSVEIGIRNIKLALRRLRKFARTGAAINIKKAQFLAPVVMRHILEKFERAGNRRLLLCERGTAFGYHNLIVDMLGFQVLKNFAYPVLFDATHALQLPGGQSRGAGGRRGQLAGLAGAGLMQGIAGLFIEAHPDPDQALCDGPCALRLDRLEDFLRRMRTIDALAKSLPDIETD